MKSEGVWRGVLEVLDVPGEESGYLLNFLRVFVTEVAIHCLCFVEGVAFFEVAVCDGGDHHGGDGKRGDLDSGGCQLA